MITLIDTPPFLEDMERKSKELATAIGNCLAGKCLHKSLEKESDLLCVAPLSLIQIIKGIFRCQHCEKTIRLYSGGDFILESGIGAMGGMSITSEFGAEIAVISQSEFLDTLSTDKDLLTNWLAYQNLETRIGHLLCSLYIGEEIRHRPEIRQYEVGEVLIREEDTTSEVYEMITGSASVTAKGYSLSVIKSGEVFGELSFFTGLQRTATVTALEACLVQVIDQKQFVRIMKYRPALVEGMLRTLCQRLVDLNIRLSTSK